MAGGRILAENGTDRILDEAGGFIVSEDFTSGVTHNITVTDDFGITDTYTKLYTKAFADAIAVSDAIEEDFIKGFLDNLAITDSVQITKARLVSPLDNVGITDTFGKTTTKGKTDNVGVTDTLGVTEGQGSQDSMGISDSFLITKIRSIPGMTSVINIVDSFAKTLKKAFSSNVNITDVIDIGIEGEEEVIMPGSIMDRDGGYSGLRTVILTELGLTAIQAAGMDMDTLIKLYWQSENALSTTVPIATSSTMDIIENGSITGPAGKHDPYEVV